VTLEEVKEATYSGTSTERDKAAGVLILKFAV
jgi:hypothetical protein